MRRSPNTLTDTGLVQTSLGCLRVAVPLVGILALIIYSLSVLFRLGKVLKYGNPFSSEACIAASVVVVLWVLAYEKTQAARK